MAHIAIFRNKIIESIFIRQTKAAKCKRLYVPLRGCNNRNECRVIYEEVVLSVCALRADKLSVSHHYR